MAAPHPARRRRGRRPRARRARGRAAASALPGPHAPAGDAPQSHLAQRDGRAGVDRQPGPRPPVLQHPAERAALARDRRARGGQAQAPAVLPGRATPSAVLLGTVAVEPVPETYVVEVRITNNDPKDAALWANTLADVYMDYSIEGQVEAARRAYKWVNERLAETQTGMQQAQDKLLQRLPGPGPVRARGQRLGDHHLDHQADRGPHPGAGAPHRARGAARRVPGGAPPRPRHRRDPPGGRATRSSRT